MSRAWSMRLPSPTPRHEQDNTNPFDCAKAVNKFVSAEYAVQLTLVLVLVLTRNWFSAVLQMAILAYLVHVCGTL